MNDLISRQAAIEEVHGAIYEFFDICDDDEESPMTYKDEKLLEINKAISGRIKALPSAQPEIIRCKDCKWYEGDIMANPWGVCCHDGWVVGHIGHEVSERGWCYRAERREEE